MATNSFDKHFVFNKSDLTPQARKDLLGEGDKVQEMGWEDWFKEVQSYANHDNVVDIIFELRSLYREYYDEGLTPQEAFDLEW